MYYGQGAIYNIGFRKGLQYWYKFLKKNGYIAVTEACWLTDSRPQEIEDFWMDAYPEIDTIPHKTAQLQGGRFMKLVTLPKSAGQRIFMFLRLRRKRSS